MHSIYLHLFKYYLVIVSYPMSYCFPTIRHLQEEQCPILSITYSLNIALFPILNKCSIKEADFYLSSVLINRVNLPKIDYSAAWAYWPFSTLLPYPKERLNLAASLEPFSYEVICFEPMMYNYRSFLETKSITHFFFLVI